MKILVTGGAGYIGSHTVVEIFEAGHTPVIVDNFCNSQKDVLARLRSILGKEIKCYEGNCCDEQFMNSVFEGEGDIKGAMHFAALKAVGESMEKPDLYHANNVGSTKVLLDMMEKFDVSFLVFSSSACVYGQPEKLPATERTPVQKPESPYGETKKICEDLISDAVHKGKHLRAISLRYFNPIGAHRSAKIGEFPIGVPNNLVPFITQTAIGKLEKLTVFGNDYNTPDGTAIRDYIHITDLAKAHVKALEYLVKISEAKLSINDNHPVELSGFYDIFNLGTGKGESVLEVIKTFEDVSGVKLNYVFGDRRQGDVESLYASCSKANSILGWKAELPLSEGLKSAWEWEKTLIMGTVPKDCNNGEITGTVPNKRQ